MFFAPLLPVLESDSSFQLRYHPWILFQEFLARSDSTKSGDISLAEFIHYVREHEKNLRLQFSHLDKNKDGKKMTLKL